MSALHGCAYSRPNVLYAPASRSQADAIRKYVRALWAPAETIKTNAQRPSHTASNRQLGPWLRSRAPSPFCCPLVLAS
ncbi:hypothetical protein IG631_16462 [Alternaria alternata]|nr:hypothetical protein IG631_16462 [Alternaria alternata]